MQTKDYKWLAAQLADRVERHWHKLRSERERLDKQAHELSDVDKFTPQYKREHLAALRAAAIARVKAETEALLSEAAALQTHAERFTAAGMMKAATFATPADESNFLQKLSRSSRTDLQATLTEAATVGDLARLREALRETRYRAETGATDADRHLLLEAERVERSIKIPDAAHAALVFQRLASEQEFVALTLRAIETGEEDPTPRWRSAQQITTKPRAHAAVADEATGVLRLDPRDIATNHNRAA